MARTVPQPPVPARSAAGLKVGAGQCSDAGVKPLNEDACGILIPAEPLLATKGVAAVVADGVSASAAAREASEACVQGFLNDYFSTPESWTAKTSGRRVLGALNRWLYGQQSAAAGHALLTTLSALIVKSATAHLFHIGDTRIYLLRDDDLECLTYDHRLWSAGDKAFLTRALGADLDIEIDYRSIPVEAGDVFLLTTDGVHDTLGAAELRALLAAQRGNPERAARLVVARALAQGSQDNVTCQVLEIKVLPRADAREYCQRLTELPFPPPLDAGMVLDGYRILRELHASKRTQIYLALDPDSGAKVVLKTPSVNFQDDPAYIDRFLHEEWAGRRIHNAHVVRAITPQRRRRFLYCVTEYVAGQSLRQWMRDHPRPGPAAVRPIVEQLAAGIRAFHRLEMVHQDIKPENILIDVHGTVKLVDFGSTRIAGIAEIATPIERDQPLGTLGYAAPEYFAGQAGSNRSDIYSLGVIAYEMLTGALPYGGPLAARTLARAQYLPARRHAPEIPAWIDGALAKAVHKDPRQRYAVLSEFIHDLSHPNAALIAGPLPLLERNPAGVWRALALGLALANLALLYLLAR